MSQSDSLTCVIRGDLAQLAMNKVLVPRDIVICSGSLFGFLLTAVEGMVNVLAVLWLVIP